MQHFLKEVMAKMVDALVSKINDHSLRVWVPLTLSTEWLRFFTGRYLAELQSGLKGENFIIYLVLLKLVEKLTKIKQKLISMRDKMYVHVDLVLKNEKQTLRTETSK